MTREDYANGYLTDFVFFILPILKPVEVFALGGGGGGKQLIDGSTIYEWAS